MAKPILLSININEQQHSISVVRKGQNYLISLDNCDAQEYKIGKSSQLLGVNEDFPVEIDEQKCLVAIRGKKIRLVANGTYVDNGEVFKPVSPIPKWYWVFFVLNILMPIISVGGAISMALAALGIYGSVAIARKEEKSIVFRVILCSLITLGAWLLWILFFGNALMAKYLAG